MRILMLFAVILLAGCDKKSTPAPAAQPATTNYQTGGGAIQNTRQAVKRTVQLNDLRNFGQLVEIQYNDTGKMPVTETMKTIAGQIPGIGDAIADGSLVLTGTAEHGGVWAYETDAPKSGGLALVGGVANRYEANDLAAKLKQ